MALRENFMNLTNNLFNAFEDVAVDATYIQREKQDYDPETGVVSSRIEEYCLKGFVMKSKQADNPNNNNQIVIKVNTADLPEELTASDRVEINDITYDVLSTNENDFVVELTLLDTRSS